MGVMPSTERQGIGSLSKKSGVNIETIRYYEREGLIPCPPRTGGGHRSYDDSHLRRLTFIRRSRELGFTLEEIRGLLDLVDGESYTCGEVRAITLNHAETVRSKIADLRRLEKTLVRIASQCRGGTTPECPIIDGLLSPKRTASS